MSIEVNLGVDRWTDTSSKPPHQIGSSIRFRRDNGKSLRRQTSSKKILIPTSNTKACKRGVWNELPHTHSTAWLLNLPQPKLPTMPPSFGNHYCTKGGLLPCLTACQPHKKQSDLHNRWQHWYPHTLNGHKNTAVWSSKLEANNEKIRDGKKSKQNSQTCPETQQSLQKNVAGFERRGRGWRRSHCNQATDEQSFKWEMEGDEAAVDNKLRSSFNTDRQAVIHSSARSFIRPYVHSCICLNSRSCICPSVIDPSISSFIHSFVHLLIYKIHFPNNRAWTIYTYFFLLNFNSFKKYFIVLIYFIMIFYA